MQNLNIFRMVPVRCAPRARVLALAFLLIGSPVRGGLPLASPQDVGLDPRHLQHIDRLVAEGLAAGEMAGCVVAVGHRGRLALLRAYGHRQLVPVRVPMTTDTVFDLASLTKPVATATSIMVLLDQGRLRLRGEVADHLPQFGQQEKSNVTILHLLTHQSGLLPDNSLSDYLNGPAAALERIWALPLQAKPEERFIYTDVGFIVLGELVKQVSGEDVHQFSQRHIFQPLGMSDTGFMPDDARRERSKLSWPRTTQDRPRPRRPRPSSR